MGYLAAILSAILLSTKDLISKKLSGTVSGTTSAFASFLFALPFYLLLLLVLFLLGYETFSLSLVFFLYVLARSITDTFAEWFKMNSFAYGDLSVMVCLHALSPVFLLFLSPLITGDPIGRYGILGVVLIVVATLILLYEPKTNGKPLTRKALYYGLGTAFFFSLNTCFDRLAVQYATPTWSAFTMTLFSAFFLAIPVYRSRAKLVELRGNTLLFSTRGAIEVVFMVAKLTALQFLQAPYTAAIQRLSILFSVLTGRIVLKERNFSRRLLAATLMLAGAGLIVLAD